MKGTPSPDEIAASIARRDRAFRSVIKVVGPPPSRRPAPVADRFGSLARSITFQLLATKAANTIHSRVLGLCGQEMSAERLIAVGVDALRLVGLSGTKAEAMVELAERTADGRLQLSRHGRMSDEQITRELTTVRGIGPWTAQMYLMGTLARRDVWPVGDFGVRHGWSLVHGLDEIVTEGELRERGAPFAGLRSAVAWYCWQAVHLERGDG